MHQNIPIVPLYTTRSDGERLFITEDLIEDLKKEKASFQHEKVKLRSRIVRMRKAYSKREQQISAVLNESKENQRLQTASLSTLQNLKKTIEILTNTLSVRQDTLRILKVKDSYWRCAEIEIEIRSLYQEQIRFEEEIRKKHDEVENNRLKVNQVYDLLNYSRDCESAIRNYNKDIKLYNEKVASYQKRKQKYATLSTEEELKREIRSLKMRLSVEELSTKKCKQSTDASLKELDEVIFQMRERIKKCLNK